MILRGSGFRLRPVRKTDAASVAELANDPEIAKNTFHIPHPYRLRDARSWISRRVRDPKEHPRRDLVFVIDVGGRAVGAIGLHAISGHKAEIGYWLGRPFWGRGIMTRAVRLVVRHAFTKLKLRRVYAYTYLWNAGSQRVLIKAGFQREGLLRKNVEKHGRLYDDYVFSRVR